MATTKYTDNYPGEKVPSDDEFKEMLANEPEKLKGMLEVVAGNHSSRALEMYVNKKSREGALHTVNEPFKSYKRSSRVFFEHKVKELEMWALAGADNFIQRSLFDKSRIFLSFPMNIR